MSALDSRLRTVLELRKQRDILRRIPDVISLPSTGDDKKVDFYTNDYLSLSTHPRFRTKFLQRIQQAPNVAGSGGSRLLVNTHEHVALEGRLQTFFNAPSATLFNSGFDANVGFFSCIPGEGDVIIYDECIHASVHDGMRSSRAKNSLYPFLHNSVSSLSAVLERLREERLSLKLGKDSVFIAVESLYSMDGDFAPLQEIVEVVERIFPLKNGHIVVDEAHSTGVYGPQGRGIVSLLGLERRVTARLHTFGKALACTGAVLLTSPLIRHYLVNYARPLIYTTAMGHASLASIETAFDLLEDGTASTLSTNLTCLFHELIESLSPHLNAIPSTLLSLPLELLQSSASTSPIIPLMTNKARPLAAFLNQEGFIIRPITWPTVPKGADRVRVCLHAANSRQDVQRLVKALLKWVEMEMEPKTSSGQSLTARRHRYSSIIEAKL